MTHPMPGAVRVIGGLILTLAVLAAALAIPGSAAAKPSADAIIREIASDQTHGWADNAVPTADLVSDVKAGKRIYVTCEAVTLVAQSMLEADGYQARLATTLTRQAFNDVDNIHVLTEVRLHGQWIVYDIDNNRQPVDSRGRGMTAATFVHDWRVDPRLVHFRILAHDQAVALDQSPVPAYSRRVATHLAWWYTRILGDLAFQGSDGRWYFGPGNRAHIKSYSSAYVCESHQAWMATFYPRMSATVRMMVADSSGQRRRSVAIRSPNVHDITSSSSTGRLSSPARDSTGTSNGG